MEFVRPLDSNELRPSFFDLLAQSNFSNLLTNLLPSSHLFHVGRAAVEMTMLALTGGTVSETVYGLERTCSRRWLLYLVTLLETNVLPHLQAPAALSRFFRLLDILFKLAYITTDSKYFSLLHAVTGVTYRHSQADIYERKDPLAKVLKALLVGGQLAVFLIQSGVFERFTSQSKELISANPPPPDQSKMTPPPHPNGYPLPKRSGICPCCLEKWSEPVAVKSSGYIYCRKCLVGRKQCPVTLFPLKELIPLFLT